MNSSNGIQTQEPALCRCSKQLQKIPWLNCKCRVGNNSGTNKKLKELIKKLQDAKENNCQYEKENDIINTDKQIQRMLMDEEMYWKQTSMADWLKRMDKNNKFFHAKALSRKQKNKIEGIEERSWIWHKDEDEVERRFCEYFQELFTTSSPENDQISAALQGLSPNVTAEMNTFLEQLYTVEEITVTLYQMGSTKAPGPDRLQVVFFHKHWEAVKNGVLATCLYILNEQGIIASLNHTYIALIPKTTRPRKVTGFRPISLCNVIYRLVAKVIANRLKQVLHKIISPTQSAFVPNILITDNIIIGYECLHKIRHSKSKKKGLVALKLDISKAYNRVE